MESIDHGVPIEAIEEGLGVVRDRIARSERDRAELDKRIAADREEERLLTRLVALRRGESLQTSADESGQADRLGDGPLERGRENPILSAVIDELTSAGRSVHISELMRLLKARRVSLPGAGTQANLIIHLRRDSRIVRPSRGMYGLAEWGLSEMPANRRRKRRRRVTTGRRNEINKN